MSSKYAYKKNDLVYVVRDIVAWPEIDEPEYSGDLFEHITNITKTVKKDSICVVVKRKNENRKPYYGEPVLIYVQDERAGACVWTPTYNIRLLGT